MEHFHVAPDGKLYMTEAHGSWLTMLSGTKEFCVDYIVNPEEKKVDQSFECKNGFPEYKKTVTINGKLCL